MSEFDKLPDRVKHYLLDFKDCNKSEFFNSFNTYRLRDLSRFNLKLLFRTAFENDNKKI